MAGHIIEHDSPNRHYTLEGERLAEGTLLEMLLEDGSWLRGRFDGVGEEAQVPRLLIALGGARGATINIDVPKEATLRRASPQAELKWPGHKEAAPVCGNGTE